MNARHIKTVILASVLALVAFSSCKQRKDIDADPFMSGLTREDTVTVLNVADTCINAIMSKNYDGRTYKFGYFIDDTLHPVDSLVAVEKLAFFIDNPIVDYEMSGFSFKSEYDNIVKFRVTCSDGKNTFKTNLTFCPVLVEGGWYMTLKENGNQN